MQRSLGIVHYEDFFLPETVGSGDWLSGFSRIFEARQEKVGRRNFLKNIFALATLFLFQQVSAGWVGWGILAVIRVCAPRFLECVIVFIVSRNRVTGASRK